MNQVPQNRYWCFGLLAASALAWDLISKAWVFAELGYPKRVSDWSYSMPLLWGQFSMQLTTWFNQGALFGIGQGLGWLFAVLSIGAAAGIVYCLFIRGQATSWWLTVTLALILAGALGNLYDRLYLHGCVDPASGKPLPGVRDFLQCDIPLVGYEWPFHFYLIERFNWPVFNFADMYLVVGAIMLTLYSLFAPAPRGQTSAAPVGTAPPMPSAIGA
ncbi:MAG: signal peptidase II [Planctomycetaceae bacterium]|nr:signal peptidase II [Planctomycetaceae bacterium]